MYPGAHAARFPDKPAIINATTGETLSYRQLDERSNRLARYLHAQGLRPGDHIALLMENRSDYLVVGWAALRSGLYITTVNRYLTPEEAAYIVDDCGARAVITSSALAGVARELPELVSACEHWLMLGAPLEGWQDYDAALASQPATPLPEEPMGDAMMYSSGSTGNPKGILRPLSGRPVSEGFTTRANFASYGFSEDMVYLSPAPLYHTAPFNFCTMVHCFGGTVVFMERFDALTALQLIEKYRVTHSQWVPTMFVRMLKLPEEDRRGLDLSSHQVAVHAAAPCPVDVKRQMIEWWGPILVEYYAGTERNGQTRISSEEWLKKPGSVGRPMSGVLHICDEDGGELPTGEPGVIYFEQPAMPFAYHNDPERTKEAQHPVHPNWSTMGDVGYVDEDGYLFLTDRRSFMIISGGVNIYPRQIEDVLILHPKVADIAVIGVPNEEFGEEVKAIVQLADEVEADADVEQELIGYAREHIAHYMVPRSVDFIDELPRLPTGKLYKKPLREKYWAGHKSRIL